MLHSFYTMPILLSVGGQLRTFTLRWYRAPAGAKYLGLPSAIFSHVWDNNPGESIPGEVGEVGAPRTWDKGDNRGGYQGQCFRGDPAWFATGKLPAVLPAPGPCPCSIPPAVALGGVVLGGAASPADVFTCMPAGLSLHASMTAPDFGPTGMTMYPGSGGTIWYILDPIYGFYWEARSVNQPCGAAPSRWTVGGSHTPNGVLNVFFCGCLTYDGSTTGTFRIPFNSPYFPGKVVSFTSTIG